MEGIPDTGRFGFFIDRNPFSYIGFAGRKQNWYFRYVDF